MTGPLTEAVFREVYAQVPRLTVEVILLGDRGVFLTRRSGGACAGLWHIPGGTVRFAEPLAAAVSRVAADELGVTVTGSELAGYIEYPSHYLNGLDHPVGLAFTVSWLGDPIAKTGADTARWFGDLPDGMHGEQAGFLNGAALRASRAGIRGSR